MVGAYSDLTARKQLDERLMQMQKIEATGELAGGIAHDFNNLLGVIIGYCDLLEESARSDPGLQSGMFEISAAAHRAASLTRQLLAFSRKQVLQPHLVDLAELVEGVRRMLEPLLPEDIALTVDVAPTVDRISIDPVQLEQVVLNLALNARDAMPRGGTLTLEASNVVLDEAYAESHPSARVGEQVMLAITDTGTGMDAATQARVFEPFFSTKPTGTGLGLASVYGIVKQSGGHIWVYSEPGHGTTFKLYFPRAEAPIELESETPAVAADDDRGGETVLVVEDAEALRRLTCKLLAAAGYTVLEADGRSQALDLAGSHRGPIHLLLTDVVLADGSGPALATELLSSRPEAKCVFMSGYTNSSVANHGVLDSATTLLSKPFTRLSLLRKVREALAA